MNDQQKTFEMMREANRKYISECGSLPDIGIIAEAEAFRDMVHAAAEQATGKSLQPIRFSWENVEQ